MNKISRLIKLLTLSVFVFSGSAQAANIFYFTSSPTSWVGGGETLTVDDSNFEFSVTGNFSNGVTVSVNDFNINPDFQNQRWWYINFAGPGDLPLATGFYDNATRWPFQDPNDPGLDFSGNGRGNNMLTGYFNVLDIAYGSGGEVLSLAIDFMQYDETFVEWFNWGNIRFNSDVPLNLQPAPVPVPAAWLLFLSAVGVIARRKKAQ